jgi:hypothetical protein
MKHLKKGYVLDGKVIPNTAIKGEVIQRVSSAAPINSLKPHIEHNSDEED